MALKVGIMGKPNSGKSYSIMFTNGKEGFVLMPCESDCNLLEDNETLNLPANKQKRVSRFRFIGKDKDSGKTIDTTLQLAKMLNIQTDNPVDRLNEIIKLLIENNSSDKATKERIEKFTQNLKHDVNYKGHFAICPKIDYIPYWCKFIDKFMPHIKNIFLPDFSQYITNVITTKEFADKGKTSSGAYGRYTDLATSTVKAFFTDNINALRDDIIVVTEFHTEKSEKDEVYSIFVPTGNMIKTTFIPESYFEVLVFAKQDFNNPNKNTRYTFQTIATQENPYIRCSVIDKEEIPNNLSIILDAIRENIIGRDEE